MQVFLRSSTDNKTNHEISHDPKWKNLPFNKSDPFNMSDQDRISPYNINISSCKRQYIFTPVFKNVANLRCINYQIYTPVYFSLKRETF